MHLLKRGAWLVILELTILRVAWTFNFDFAHYEMAGVIWAIGWCMILMAGLVKFPLRVVAVIGIVIVAGHNLLDSYVRELIPTLGNDLGSVLWKILYVSFWAGPISLGQEGPNFIVLYSIIPWVGVMAVGYAFGQILTLEQAKRDRMCLGIGLGAIPLFLMLRGFNIYGDPRPWNPPSMGPDGPQGLPAILAFLNTSKYPASLLFLLMTLGPTIALIPVLERARGAATRFIALFGRVPFFFYVLHIPLIHTLALIVSSIRLGSVSPWLFENHPMGNSPPPDGYMWSLGTLYIVWAIAIAILYPLCRWYDDFKSKRKSPWLSYL
jgi:uncharacterized membrane protein